MPVVKIKSINKITVDNDNRYDLEIKDNHNYFASNILVHNCRGMYILDKGLFTRKGKQIIGFESTIEKDCKNFCKRTHTGAVDGELFSTTIPFEKIQGAVMRNKNIKPEEKEQISFNVFALLLNFDNRIIFDTTKKMVDTMDKAFTGRFEYKYLNRVVQTEITIDQIDALHDNFVEQGYEGIMLRDVKKSYSFKRDNAILKFKKFKEDDFKIVDIFEGEGKYSGMLGGFVVKGKVDGKTIKSSVGSGFSDAQRKEYWDTLFPAKTKVIGKLAEIKYQGLTPDGSLRFPVFNHMKEDR